MRLFAKALAAIALLLSACNDDLPKISLVSEMDIFGLRAEVQGEPERATPSPGESAQISLSLVYPELGEHDAELSIAMLECTYPERFIGAPVCQEFIDGLSGGGAGESTGLEGSETVRCSSDLTFPAGPLTLRCLSGKRTFELPVKSSAEGDRLLLGIVCRNGIATIGAEGGQPGFSCATDGEATGELEEELFSATVYVQLDKADMNLNPSFDGTRVTLNEDDWADFAGGAPVETDCDDPDVDLPRLIPEDEVELHLGLDPGQREKVDGAWETLRVSHRAAAGEFERSSSYIPPERKVDEDGTLGVDVTWTAPKRDEYDQRLVEFHFGLRDGRGGFATTSRFACLP